MSIKETLNEYKNKDIYPFHMPGHKRNVDEHQYKIDMTEVEGVDDLHDPSGPILEDQKRLAKLYNADDAFILVGGSTVGNLAAIYAATSEGDTLLIQRNSHKSVYNGATIRHNIVEYIDPKTYPLGIYEPVNEDALRDILELNKNIKAVVLTSPTYEGYHCQVEIMAKICHERNIILIVDQAHGAHLGFAEDFSNSAAAFADITICSLHKTLPCLTQTAVMFVKGDRINRNRIKEALDIFETSSPSYVLMESVSSCIDFLTDNKGMFDEYVDNLYYFYKECEELVNLRILYDFEEVRDPGKLIIATDRTKISGVELARILREKYRIETEMSSLLYVIAMTSVMDTREGFERLVKALFEIDSTLEEGNQEALAIGIKANKKMELYEAKAGMEKNYQLSASVGKIAAGMICIYPPGAPIVIPGEEITEEAIRLINDAREAGLHVSGIDDDSISVVN